MKAAFYKGTRPGLQGIYSRAVRWIDRGPYSHAELVFSDGLSASASYIDGGVRFKRIDYNPAHWDFVALPDAAEPFAREWFRANDGAPYDLMGNVRFVLPWLADSERGWFCSEALGGGAQAQGAVAIRPQRPCGTAALARPKRGFFKHRGVATP